MEHYINKRMQSLSVDLKVQLRKDVHAFRHVWALTQILETGSECENT